MSVEQRPGPERTGASALEPGPAPPREPSGSSLSELFRTRDVIEILDLSRRQLQYWAQTGLVEPSVKTPGGHHRYTFEDLVALKATKRLIDAGVSVQRIRHSISALRSILPNVERPLAELILVATGEVVLVFKDGVAFEAVSGQEWVFEVAKFQREVEAWQSDGAAAGESAPGKKARRQRKSAASKAEKAAVEEAGEAGEEEPARKARPVRSEPGLSRSA